MSETFFVVPVAAHEALVSTAYQHRGYDPVEADHAAKLASAATRHGIRTHNAIKALHLDELFAKADYISLHTNLTPETRDLVRAETIAKMKPGVIILNCARGEIVNTADIAAALESGRVRGYGTDVLDEEPPRADHPLTKLPNCVVTPHVGSRTHESVQRQAMAAVTNLIRSMHGEPPLAQVNPTVPVKKVV